jgi:signal transduction histidine kinase
MTQRAEAIDAELRITSTPGAGTVVTLIVDLPSP